MTTSPRAGFTDLVTGQAVPETSVNEIGRRIEQGANLYVLKDRDLSTPPGSPADGDCYLVKATGTGAWAGHDSAIAFYMNTAWEFITVKAGDFAWVIDEGILLRYHSSAWAQYAPSLALGDLPAIALDDLSDVDATSPGDGEVLTWDAGSGAYVPAPAPGSGGGAGGTVPNGGEAKDVLRKASGVDQDVEWAPVGAGALLYLSANQAGHTSSTEVPFDLADYNDAIDPGDGGGTQRFWLGANKTMTVADTTADTLTITGHGLTTGEGPILFTNSGGALPGGMAAGTKYWAIVVDANTISLATNRANAMAGTKVDITSAGTGTHTLATGAKLVVPKGVTRVQLGAATGDNSDLAGDVNIYIYKNGASGYPGMPRQDGSSVGIEEVSMMGPPLAVSEGDYFTFQDVGADAYTMLATATWFSIVALR